MMSHTGLLGIKCGSGNSNTKICSMPYLWPKWYIQAKILNDSWYWKPAGFKVQFTALQAQAFTIIQYTNHYGVFDVQGRGDQEYDNSHTFETLKGIFTSGAAGHRGIKRHLCVGKKTIYVPFKGRNIPIDYRLGSCNNNDPGVITRDRLPNNRGYWRTEWLARGLDTPYIKNGYTMFFIESGGATATEHNSNKDYSRLEEVVRCEVTYFYRVIGPKKPEVTITGGPFPSETSMLMPWTNHQVAVENFELYNPGNFAAQCPDYDNGACDVEPDPAQRVCWNSPKKTLDPPVVTDPVVPDPNPPADPDPPVVPTTCPFKNNVTFE